jgi:hypothetical protein
MWCVCCACVHPAMVVCCFSASTCNDTRARTSQDRRSCICADVCVCTSVCVCVCRCESTSTTRSSIRRGLCCWVCVYARTHARIRGTHPRGLGNSTVCARAPCTTYTAQCVPKHRAQLRLDACFPFQAIAEAKKCTKQGDTNGARVMAKEVVRIRNSKEQVR